MINNAGHKRNIPIIIHTNLISGYNLDISSKISCSTHMIIFENRYIVSTARSSELLTIKAVMFFLCRPNDSKYDTSYY